jgi:hypothetical protein
MGTTVALHSTALLPAPSSYRWGSSRRLPAREAGGRVVTPVSADELDWPVVGHDTIDPGAVVHRWCTRAGGSRWSPRAGRNMGSIDGPISGRPMLRRARAHALTQFLCAVEVRKFSPYKLLVFWLSRTYPPSEFMLGPPWAQCGRR